MDPSTLSRSTRNVLFPHIMSEAAASWSEVGARIAQARKAAQLSQAELASAVQLDRTAITKLEAGERKLDSLELVRIARTLKRSLDWFLAPPLPAVVSRRQRRGSTDESRADALLEGLARDVKLLVELGLLAPAVPPTLLAIDSVERAEQAARQLRLQLGVAPGPVWELSRLSESLGCYAFSLDLGDESLDGAYLRLDPGGVALTNGRNASGRRRFTLLHELGHHLLADDCSTEWIVGVDGEDRERLINAFVIHFLLPREACLARWSALGGAHDPRGAAIALAAEFGLSWSAVVLQLKNLGLIDAAAHERLLAWRPTRAEHLEAGVELREELQAPMLSPRFSQAVLRALRQRKISRSRALELLRGTVAAGELPPEDPVPVEAMRDQFDLE